MGNTQLFQLDFPNFQNCVQNNAFLQVQEGPIQYVSVIHQKMTHMVQGSHLTADFGEKSLTGKNDMLNIK
jgi:hypothetical protein